MCCCSSLSFFYLARLTIIITVRSSYVFSFGTWHITRYHQLSQQASKNFHHTIRYQTEANGCDDICWQVFMLITCEKLTNLPGFSEPHSFNTSLMLLHAYTLHSMQTGISLMPFALIGQFICACFLHLFQITCFVSLC